MYTNAISGTAYDSAKLFDLSAIKPIRGVKTAPPMIAITSSDPPSFVFGPSPFNPSAKIVGNISDIKKLVRNNAHNPIQPGIATPMSASKTFTALYIPISFPGDMNRIKYADEKRPTPNAANVPVRKYPATFSG